MIKILGFRKQYFKKTILESNKLEFQNKGFYLIYGRSGCGKTTLLNCLSLLEDFDGDYFIYDKNVKELNDDEKAKVRKEMISYVHQKPVLLNDFTVFDNIKLFSNLKEGEIYNYLSMFQLKERAHQQVKYLSGGEKQRISLIKSIILEKPIILADEPTGALDKNNAVFIIEKLKELSKKVLVIVVSHDVATYKQYADTIIKVKNKSIEIEREHKNKENIKKNLYKNSTFNERFIRKKYTRHIIRKRRVKNGLVSFFTSLSLICVSLTMLIAFNVREELMNGFSQFYKPNEVLIQSRNKNDVQYRKDAPSEDELFRIETKLPNITTRPFYSNNFETFFKDANSLHLILKYRTVQIEGFSARHFNEFKDKNSANPEYFIKDEFENDEIVISIDNPLMLELCYQLSITKTFKSLFNYIKKNEVYLSLFVKNFDWEYEDEQIFRLVGFVVEPERFIYHSDPKFAELVFEENMKLPHTIYDEIQDRPRYLKKEYILDIDQNSRDLFYYDDYLSSFYIEKLKRQDFHFWYDENIIKQDNLYKIYKKSVGDILPSNKIKWLKENNYDFNLINNYYMKSNLVSGFVNEIFLTEDQKTLAHIEDNYFKSDLTGQIKVDESLNIVSSGLLVESSTQFYLEKTTEELPLNEVGISRKLYEKFPKSLQNSTIFVIGLANRYQNGTKIVKEYFKSEIKIGKIIENNDDYVLYGNEFFMCNFFRDYLGYEYQKYVGSAVNLIINGAENEEIIHQYFYNFDVTKPFNEINLQINNIINILEIILSAFSLIIICISIFLLSLIIRSFILDFREDLHVLYCNGLSKKQIGKIFKRYLINTFAKASFAMLIFNLGMSFLISYIVSNSLNIGLKFNFSYLAIACSLILSIFMIFIGFLFVNKFIKQENIVISIRN